MHPASLSVRLGDYRRVLWENLSRAGRPVALLTITGPSDNGWSDEQYRTWNRNSAPNFRKADRMAKSSLRRQGLRVTPLARIAQRQRRGVDHLHIVLSCSPHERAAVSAYVTALRQASEKHDFGFVDDPFKRTHPKLPNGRPNRALPARDRVYLDPVIAGRYLVSYLSDSSQLVRLVEATDSSFRPLWISPELTQQSRVTMRRLRRARHFHFLKDALSIGARPTLPVWWDDFTERHRISRIHGHVAIGVP